MFGNLTSNRDDMRKTLVSIGINEAAREFTDQCMRMAEDKKAEVGRSIKHGLRVFQLDGMKNSFTVGQRQHDSRHQWFKKLFRIHILKVWPCLNIVINHQRKMRTVMIDDEDDVKTLVHLSITFFFSMQLKS